MGRGKEGRKGNLKFEQISLKQNIRLRLKVQINIRMLSFQAKDFNKVGPEIKVVATNENEGVISQEEVDEAKNILEVKVHVGMLQTLQWAGWI